MPAEAKTFLAVSLLPLIITQRSRFSASPEKLIETATPSQLPSLANSVVLEQPVRARVAANSRA